MKAYRNGMCTTDHHGLQWFGAGTLPAWQVHLEGIIPHYCYKGHHRGKYKPSLHWSHIKCYPNGICHIATKSIKLTPYVYARGQAWSSPGGIKLPPAQPFTFTEEQAGFLLPHVKLTDVRFS